MNKYILVYTDEVISVGLFSANNLLHLAMKWDKPKPYKNKEGKIKETTNIMNGETDWFILPFSFASAVGKTLIEQKTAGLPGFYNEGFKLMVDWLIDLEVITDAMCY